MRCTTRPRSGRPFLLPSRSSSTSLRSPAGVRPYLLLEPQGPEDGDQLRTVEQSVGFVPLVQILDAPVPQTGEQLVSFFKFLDTQMPVEQVMAVPKITKDLIQPRLVDCDQRDPQMAEQLVEVPTIVSCSSLQRTMAQLVDLPVPGRGGRNAGLQGFPSEQSSTATLSSAERISERIVEQNVDIPVAAGGLQEFRPGQSSSSVARSPADWFNTEDEAFQGFFFFSHFSPKEKVRHNLRTRGRNCPRTRAHGRRLLMTSPWCLRRRRSLTITLSSWWGCEWVLALRQECWCLAAADGSQIGHTIWRPPWLIGRGPG